MNKEDKPIVMATMIINYKNGFDEKTNIGQNELI